MGEKCFFFFKWVRILPEIDWYHYQSAAAPTCIIRHQTMTKTPTRGSIPSEPNMCVWGEEGTVGSDVKLHLVGVFVIV